MDGRGKLQRQIKVGTRPLVEAIDNLRLNFGFENVKALTPIVETKLRNGNIPQRPLQMIFFPVPGHNLSFIITIPIRFPEEPYHLGLQAGISIPVENVAEYTILEEQISMIAQEHLNSVVDGVRSAKFVLSDPSNHWVMDLTRGEDGVQNIDISIDDVEEEDENEVEIVVVEPKSETKGPKAAVPTYYSCRICSTQLFVVDDITHSKSRKGACPSIYLNEAPEFLVTNGEEQEGKIYCPKCAARIGAWSWVGIRCSCKEWIAPAFQFVTSKIDGKSN